MRSLLVMIVIILAYGAPVKADNYSWAANTLPFHETVISLAYYRHCQRTLDDAGNPTLAGCAAGCVCTPNTTQKQTFIFEHGPLGWFDERQQTRRLPRQEDVCRLYRDADDETRIQADTVLGLPAFPIATEGDSYSWPNIETTAEHEVVIQWAYSEVCRFNLSSNVTLPVGCDSACNCSPTTQQKQDFIFQAGFLDWFDRELVSIRHDLATRFCSAYQTATMTQKDSVDAFFGLPPLP